MYPFISYTSTALSFSMDNLSLTTASSSFKNKRFIISSAISSQSAIMNSFAFLMVDIILPLSSLFVTILYVMDYGSLSMLSSMSFFQIFSLAVRIAALYFWRQFRKAFRRYDQTARTVGGTSHYIY